jgi:hypothetical protein
MFGFFTFGWKELDQKCYAAYGSKTPLPNSSSTNGVDVGARFKMAMVFGFTIMILNVVRVIANQLSIKFNALIFYKISIGMYGVNFMLFLVWFSLI